MNNERSFPLLMLLLWVMYHQFNFISPQRLELLLSVLKSQLSWYFLLTDFTIEWEIAPHDGNNQQSGQIKNKGTHDRIPSNPAIFRHKASIGARRRCLTEYDTPTRSMGTSIRQFFYLGAWWNPRTVSFVQAASKQHPHRRSPVDHLWRKKRQANAGTTRSHRPTGVHSKQDAQHDILARLTTCITPPSHTPSGDRLSRWWRIHARS
jgi:hypothetical protein